MERSNTMEAILDGKAIQTVRDVHEALARALDFGPYYGFNLAALWDRLSTDVPRPVRIVWEDASTSKERLGDAFEAIVRVFDRAKREDQDLPPDRRFDYELR